MSSLPRGDGSSARPRILLAGGGHTHLAALVPLVTQLQGRADIAVMAPDPELLYSGMMPGWLANQYTFRDCAIPLRAWALSVGARWLDDAIAEVDFRPMKSWVSVEAGLVTTSYRSMAAPATRWETSLETCATGCWRSSRFLTL